MTTTPQTNTTTQRNALQLPSTLYTIYDDDHHGYKNTLRREKEQNAAWHSPGTAPQHQLGAYWVSSA